MLFAKYERCLYQRSPLIEVICQLRFPTILSIGSQEPAEFQEAIRHEFPQFVARQERPTLRYTRWEDFAQKLDKAVAAFLQIYHADYFERVGLRYVNAISKERLGLNDLLWDDLLQTPYIGILGEPDVDEKEVNKCSLDIETRLGTDSRLKLHAGPGLLNGGKQDPKPRFILDQDLSSVGKLTPDQLPERLEILHGFAGGLFHGAITDELHEAMGPMAL